MDGAGVISAGGIAVDDVPPRGVSPEDRTRRVQIEPAFGRALAHRQHDVAQVAARNRVPEAERPGRLAFEQAMQLPAANCIIRPLIVVEPTPALAKEAVRKSN